MKRKIGLVLLICMALMVLPMSGLFAQGQKDAAESRPVIAFSIMDFSIDFLVELLASARLTAEELDVDLVDYNSQFDTVKQVNNIEDAIAQRVDCLLLHPVESSAVVPGVLAANDAGIPVVAVDIKPTKGDLACFVASDNTSIGKFAAEEVVKHLIGKHGKAEGDVVILGNDMISSMRLRKAGVLEVFASHPGIDVVDMHDFATKLDTTIEVTENVLQKYGEGTLDMIIALNSTQAIGANAVVSSAKRMDVSIMGIDKDIDILNAIIDENSTLIGTVVQSPYDMGKIAVEQCVKVINGQTIEKDFFEAPIKVVTKTNVQEYLEYSKELDQLLAPYKVK
jgi:ABC-type sugar transport system substrate-binding protein